LVPKTRVGRLRLFVRLFGTTRWLTAVSTPDTPRQETTQQAMAILDAQFAWLRGAENPVTGKPVWDCRLLLWIPDDGDRDSETMSIKITK